VRRRHIQRRLGAFDRNPADARRAIVADAVAVAAPVDSALDRGGRIIAALNTALDAALDGVICVVAVDDALHDRRWPCGADTLLGRAPVADAVIAVAAWLYALDLAGLADLDRTRGRRLADLAHLDSAIGPDVRFGALRAFGTLRALGTFRAFCALGAFGALRAIRALGLLRVTVGFVLRRRKRRRRNTCKKCGE
jgi:hypothetical protein